MGTFCALILGVQDVSYPRGNEKTDPTKHGKENHGGLKSAKLEGENGIVSQESVLKIQLLRKETYQHLSRGAN